MKKQLQQSSNNKTAKRIRPFLFTLSLMLASVMGWAQTAYITNYSDNNVYVINVTTNTVIDTIKVGNGPNGVAVSSDGSKVYITNVLSSSLSIINTATDIVLATIPVGTRPTGVCVTPDGSKVYVVNFEDNTVSVINTTTNTVTATIKVGAFPYGAAVSPDGRKVYVTNSYYIQHSTVSVINTATDTVSATITVGSNAQGLIVSPDGSKVYVANGDDSTVSVINTITDTVLTNIIVGIGNVGISISPDGNKVYVTGGTFSNGIVNVINAITNAVSATISFGFLSQPVGISVSPDGNKVYVVNEGKNKVSVIDAATNTISDSIKVGFNNPVGIGNFISTHQTVGIPSYSINASTISLYPNPATNQLTIHPVGWSSNGVNSSSFHNEAVMVSVMNVMGQEVSPPQSLTPALSKGEGDATINIGALPAGMYFLQMKGENWSVVKKFVKE